MATLDSDAQLSPEEAKRLEDIRRQVAVGNPKPYVKRGTTLPGCSISQSPSEPVIHPIVELQVIRGSGPGYLEGATPNPKQIRLEDQ